MILILLFAVILSACSSHVDTNETTTQLDHDLLDDFDDEFGAEEEQKDPLEPWNRFWFGFNDKFHYYAFNPVAEVYDFVVPSDIQMVVGNAFHNIATPVRLVSSVLQGDLDKAGKEVSRFVINSTLGVFGFGDPAAREFDIIVEDDEDIGQVLAVWGVEEGWYIVWPFLGPSTTRDSIGLVGDIFLKPTTYLGDFQTSISINSEYYINNEAIHLGDYRDIVKASLDPYVATRDIYLQYRRDKIRK